MPTMCDNDVVRLLLDPDRIKHVRADQRADYGRFDEVVHISRDKNA